jgi:hypothetical protein
MAEHNTPTPPAPDAPPAFVSASCSGERCPCGAATTAHKVEESIPWDDPMPSRHPYTQYVCRECFCWLMHRQPHPLAAALRAAESARAEAERERDRLRDAAQEAWRILDLSLGSQGGTRVTIHRTRALQATERLANALGGLPAPPGTPEPAP